MGGYYWVYITVSSYPPVETSQPSPGNVWWQPDSGPGPCVVLQSVDQHWAGLGWAQYNLVAANQSSALLVTLLVTGQYQIARC